MCLIMSNFESHFSNRKCALFGIIVFFHSVGSENGS